MAQYRTITEFLIKIRETYNEARKKYEEHWSKIESLAKMEENELKAVRINAERNAGQAEEAIYVRKKYEKAVNVEKEAIRNLISVTNARFDEIIAECDTVFAPYNRPTSAKVDNNALVLLNSGVLRPEEIKALAEDYAGNCTMLRLIGAHAYERGEKEKNVELRAFGLGLKNYSIPYKEFVDVLIGYSQKALREEKGLADGIARIYDEAADGIFAKAEGFSVPVE